MVKQSKTPVYTCGLIANRTHPIKWLWASPTEKEKSHFNSLQSNTSSKGQRTYQTPIAPGWLFPPKNYPGINHSIALSNFFHSSESVYENKTKKKLTQPKVHEIKALFFLLNMESPKVLKVGHWLSQKTHVSFNKTTSLISAAVLFYPCLEWVICQVQPGRLWGERRCVESEDFYHYGYKYIHSKCHIWCGYFGYL